MNTFHLTLISPEGKVYDAPAEAIVAPGEEGLFGVLAGHAVMVASLKAGDVKIAHGGTEEHWDILPGILEVNSQHNVLMLVDQAQKKA